MTNRDLLTAAARQSAVDCCCRAEDFFSDRSLVVLSQPSPAARCYPALPFLCHLVSYGRNVVASVSAELADEVADYLDSYPACHCFETPNMQVLSAILRRHGADICFQAEYFLPDLTADPPPACPLPTKLLTPDGFAGLYTPEWSNALCGKRPHLDRLAAAAFDGEAPVGLAGASADCEELWQIGIDVLPSYRRRGIASALTAQLSAALLRLGKVPFYCCAWSNIPSARNALRAGFRPAWVELTAKPIEEIEKINREAKLPKGESSC